MSSEKGMSAVRRGKPKTKAARRKSSTRPPLVSRAVDGGTERAPERAPEHGTSGKPWWPADWRERGLETPFELLTLGVSVAAKAAAMLSTKLRGDPIGTDPSYASRLDGFAHALQALRELTENVIVEDAIPLATVQEGAVPAGWVYGWNQPPKFRPAPAELRDDLAQHAVVHAFERELVDELCGWGRRYMRAGRPGTSRGASQLDGQLNTIPTTLADFLRDVGQMNWRGTSITALAEIAADMFVEHGHLLERSARKPRASRPTNLSGLKRTSRELALLFEESISASRTRSAEHIVQALLVAFGVSPRRAWLDVERAFAPLDDKPPRSRQRRVIGQPPEDAANEGVRRLRALVREGHTYRAIARKLRVHERAVRLWESEKRKRLSLENRQRWRDAYGWPVDVWDQPAISAPRAPNDSTSDTPRRRRASA